MKQQFWKYLSALLTAFALLSFTACSSTPTSRSTAEVAEDAAITTQVNAAFAGNTLVKAYQIDVDTYRKEVTLSGKVESQAAINKAVELARGVSDVKSVKNNLTIKK